MESGNMLEIRLLKDAKLSHKIALHQWFFCHFHGGDSKSMSGIY